MPVFTGSQKIEEENWSFKKRINIGTKLVLGVALASNLCILGLLYSVRYWDREVNSKSEDLLQIQKNLNQLLQRKKGNQEKRKKKKQNNL